MGNRWLVRLGHPAQQLRSEMDRVFSDVFGDFFGEPVQRESARPLARSWATVWPSLDVSEREDAIMVRAEVPGVNPDEFELSVADDVLTISGEKKEESEEKRDGYYHSERRFGSFRRSVLLPAAVDREKVKAEYDRGVLMVTLPKSEKTVAKRIPVSVSRN